MTKPKCVDLNILEFSKEGHGQGIWQAQSGKTNCVEVPFSIPGDQVRVNLLKRKSGFFHGEPLEWLQLSPQRINPRCLHFGSCGGCRWQQISYEDQLKQKEAKIHTLFDSLIVPETLHYPIIPCFSPWNYRNKMELTFSSDKKGNRYLGLILNGTRGHVFQMQECHLFNPWIINAVHAVSKWWSDSELDAYHSYKDTGALRTLTLREGIKTGDRMVILTVSGNPSYALSQKQLESFVKELQSSVEPSSSQQQLSIFLRIQQIAKGSPTRFCEMHLYGPDHIRERIDLTLSNGEVKSLDFRISPSAFFQPNTKQAEQIYSRAIQLSQLTSNDVVYDLYCGAGTLGICLAHQVKKVIGIELSPESALDAKENIKFNGLSNVSIRTGDVVKLLPTVLEELKPQHIFVDPPRSGLDQGVLKQLLTSKVPKLTYISCNPMTQVSNVETLIKGGYRIKAIQPVDQFPQTMHMENIVVATL